MRVSCLRSARKPSYRTAVEPASRVGPHCSKQKASIRRNSGGSFLCNAQGGDSSNADDEEEDSILSNQLEGTVERMLLESPAVKSAIARITAASERYEQSLRRQEELVKRVGLTDEQREELAKITEQHVLNKAEVEATKKQLRAAELRMLSAAEEQNILADMARQNADRVESVKAFTVASVGGIFAMLPYLVIQSGDLERDLLNIFTTALSAGLFGITYRFSVLLLKSDAGRGCDDRYAIGDGKNVQLKIGVVSAFWIVSSLASAQSAWSTISAPLSHFDIHAWNKIGLQSVQLLIVFLTSTSALEYSIRSGFVRCTANAA